MIAKLRLRRGYTPLRPVGDDGRVDPSSRYKLLRPISRGGMGEVFEARALAEGGFERRIAIKRLLREHAADPSFCRAFIDEVRIASKLHHANIITVFDFGVHEGQPFLAMELVDGLDLISLRQRAAARSSADPIPAEVALHVATEVAHALAYAHAARDERHRPMGIIHRDVSPQNVLISWEGDIKLADFGIARARRRLEATRVGVAKGKLDFMAPEQAHGWELDARADLFSLGCVLHWMLTGRSPAVVDPTNPTPAARRLEIERGGPDDLLAIIERATSLDRDARYKTAEEMSAACGAALALRLKLDARGTLRHWLSRLRQEASASEPSLLSELFQPRLDSPAGEARVFEEETTEGTGEWPASTTPDASPAEALLGSVLHGFRLVELIGQGTATRVYRAEHTLLPRHAAIKVLHASQSTMTSVAQERLMREGAVLTRLSHPNLVAVYDVGIEVGGAGPFVTMELLAGHTLESEMFSGPLPVERAARIARMIASGLAEVHRHGLVHGDLRPENIMLVPGTDGAEQVKILGLGPFGPEAASAPAYSAPEQIASAGAARPSADLYSLGVILYALLSGRLPFVGSAEDMVLGHQIAVPPPLPACGGLEDVALGLLEKDPGRRLESADALAAALARWVAGPSGRALGANDHRPGTRLPPWPGAGTLNDVTPLLGEEETRQPPAPSAGLGRPTVLQWWALAALIPLAAAAVWLLGREVEDGRAAAREPEPAPPVVVSVPSARAATVAQVEAEEEGAEAEEASPAAPPLERPQKHGRPARRDRARPVLEPERPSHGNPPTATPAPEPDVDRALEIQLGRRGLLIADLEGSAALERWRQAKHAGASAQALLALITELGATPITRDILETKLRRISRRISSLSPLLSPADVDTYEDRYFELRDGVASGSPQDALARRLFELELELARRP